MAMYHSFQCEQIFNQVGPALTIIPQKSFCVTEGVKKVIRNTSANDYRHQFDVSAVVMKKVTLS